MPPDGLGTGAQTTIKPTIASVAIAYICKRGFLATTASLAISSKPLVPALIVLFQQLFVLLSFNPHWLGCASIL